MKVINLEQKFSMFSDHWSPKIIAETNGQHVKLAKVKGEFVWHDHREEDELFILVKGKLFIDFRESTVELNEGEIFVVPKGKEHRPRTEPGREAWIMLIEPASTKHTGEVESEITVKNPDFI